MMKKSTEKMIAQVNASMAIEGMPLRTADKARLRDCMDGRRSFVSHRKEIVEKYKRANAR